MMRKATWKVIGIFLVVVLLVTALAACTAAPTEEAEVAGPKGDLVFAQTGSFGTTGLDPHTAISGSARQTHLLLHGGLVRKDETGAIKPDIADSWEIDDAYTKFTFYLDEKAKFHNGEPVTAEDVKFSLERYISQFFGRMPIYGLELEKHLDRIEVFDEHTVMVYMSAPYINFFDRLTEYFAIAPKKYVEEVGDDGYAQKTIGCGPFKLVSFTQDTTIKLEANEEHHRKVPSVKTVLWQNVPEMSTRIAMLKTGEAHIAPIEGIGIKEVEVDPDLRVAWGKYARLQQVVFCDLAHPEEPSPFFDVRVRQAVSHAIDRDALADKVAYGGLLPSGGFVAPYQWGYDPNLPAQDIEYNPEKAKQLLTEAGYPDGFKTKMYLQLYPTLAEAIPSYLEAVGIQVEIIPIEQGSFATSWKAWKSDGLNLWECTMAARNHPLSSIYVQYRKGEASGGYSNTPELDAMLDDFIAQPTNKERMKAVLQYMTDSYLRVNLGFGHQSWGVSSTVESWEPIPGVTWPSRLEYAVLKD